MIVEYPQFLTPEECGTLISLGEAGGLVIAATNAHLTGYRKAKVRWFDNQHPLVKKICSKVAEFTETKIEKQESLHFVKYESNGEYKPHFDGDFRHKTALIYLNTSYKGGETYFPTINRKIIPEVGKLVVWDNIDIEGKKDPDSYHAGLPVEFGSKYIAVIWIQK